MLKAFAFIAVLTTGVLCADASPPLEKSTQTIETGLVQKNSTFNSFTGKILGNNVRMRCAPDLDSHIISEFSKDDYVVVIGEQGDFYAIAAPSDFKAYI